jgi:glutathione S-transferase
MSDLTLFFSPGACSKVPLIALEQIGAPFETSLVTFANGGNRTPDYLQMNPGGKVPTLKVGDRAIIQNVAILTYLAGAFPDAALLPKPTDDIEAAQLLGWLSWCSSDLHPLVTRFRIPNFACDLPNAAPRVREIAVRAFSGQFAFVEQLLGHQPWVLGDIWSVVDAYLYWVWWRIVDAGFDTTPYPNLVKHAASMEQRPAVQRALRREAEAQAYLEEKGLAPNFAKLSR